MFEKGTLKLKGCTEKWRAKIGKKTGEQKKRVHVYYTTMKQVTSKSAMRTKQ